VTFKNAYKNVSKNDKKMGRKISKISNFEKTHLFTPTNRFMSLADHFSAFLVTFKVLFQMTIFVTLNFGVLNFFFTQKSENAIFENFPKSFRNLDHDQKCVFLYAEQV